MKLADLITFRKDRLFQGAVQISWFETDPSQSKKAAENFVFHGPDYHGAGESDIDTATFVRDILTRITGEDNSSDPFTLAIAGWGTGKSHLGVTIAELLSEPDGDTAERIIDNIKEADDSIGSLVSHILTNLEQPFLVLTINGMQDFNLSREIIRQVFLRLKLHNLDIKPLEDLRPRFKSAKSFVESFYESLEKEFSEIFGRDIKKEVLLQRLLDQDEEVFEKISRIFEDKMGTPIISVGQESLQEFMSVLRKTYCGPDKAFKGIFIIFDEFGRYLEFAVQKPYVAGSGVLQQLFEAVQAESDVVSLLCFIQYELKAYMSRVAPEFRDGLNRYVTRYDSATRVHLSTNLETLIASLIQKNDEKALKTYIEKNVSESEKYQTMHNLKQWFPDSSKYPLWIDPAHFSKIIVEGCWPLHPMATWFLYKLSAAGKSLQNRSALYLLALAIDQYRAKEVANGYWTLPATALCTDDMINEFIASERFGQQGAMAHAYSTVINKYSHEFKRKDVDVLKAILLASKVSCRGETQQEWEIILGWLSARQTKEIKETIKRLTSEHNVIEWNDSIHQFEIIGDALPRRAFLDVLEVKISEISLDKRGELFTTHIKDWLSIDHVETDFGMKNQITTPEWKYTVTISTIQMLGGHIAYAIRNWREAVTPDDSRGQLIYCYVGPDSDYARVLENSTLLWNSTLKKLGFNEDTKIPLLVAFLHDKDGNLGKLIAEHWILANKSNDEDMKRFTNFIMDRQPNALEELQGTFRKLENEGLLFAGNKQLKRGIKIRDALYDLFNGIYTSCIPFPFDGFHKTKGGAAKDCQVFTTELFRGSLTQSYIATRNAQQRNRLVSVLNNSWKALGSDGLITTKPRNISVAKICATLDSRLKAGISVNLGSFARELCLPPYGCNIASAGMLIGLFICPRHDKLWFLIGSEIIPIDKWLSGAFIGNYLSLNYLESTVIKAVDIGATDEWNDLLSSWDSEKKYRAQLDWIFKAYELKKRIPLPPDRLHHYELLANRSKEAQDELERWDIEIEKQDEFLEKAYQKQNAGNISRCGAELARILDRMNNKEDAWLDEDFSRVEDLLQKAKNATKQFFPSWVKREVIIDLKAWGDFDQKMRRIQQNLTTLGLPEERKKLEDHVDRIRSDIDQNQRIKFVVDEGNAFANSQIISEFTKVKDLHNIIIKAKEILDTIQSARSNKSSITIPQLDSTASRIRNLRDRCQKQLDADKERGEQLWNSYISRMGDISDILREVVTLRDLYEGQEKDLEDFKTIESCLRMMSDHFQEYSSLQLKDEEQIDIFATCLSKAKDVFDNEELPWDIEETYNKLLDTCKMQRREQATRWIEASVPASSAILTLDAVNVNQIRAKMQNPPAYLSEDDLIKVHAAITLCDKRLDELDVDGLVVKFQGLSEKAKAIFLERIKEML
ncbi:MAG: hypothetical protein BWX92_01653 [Deltaproteobacteria bacterium ADurb.Bin135]|jgi:hypothetical protein|nr:MAG: hypothetical protein BWX92_01653 [Deltaproteobacteria bacterium ADurb.Bin135]